MKIQRTATRKQSGLFGSAPSYLPDLHMEWLAASPPLIFKIGRPLLI